MLALAVLMAAFISSCSLTIFFGTSCCSAEFSRSAFHVLAACVSSALACAAAAASLALLQRDSNNCSGFETDVDCAEIRRWRLTALANFCCASNSIWWTEAKPQRNRKACNSCCLLSSASCKWASVVFGGAVTSVMAINCRVNCSSCKAMNSAA